MFNCILNKIDDVYFNHIPNETHIVASAELENGVT